MPYVHIWSSGDLDAVRLEAQSVMLHRVTPAIVTALNGRASLPRIELAGDDLDDEQVTLLGDVQGLDGVALYGGEGLSDAGFASILAIKELRHVRLLSAKASEESLASLGDCPAIESLVFDNTVHVTERVIGSLARLPRLRTLFLEVWELGREAFLPLANLRALRVLQVDAGPAETDHAPLFSNRDLETLRLYSWGGGNTPTEADRVVEMAWGLSKLKELVLSHYPVSGAALMGVANLHELQTLDLGANRHVGAAVARAISRLKKLRVLRIGRTAVTDESLEYLATLPSLTSLRLFECPLITGGGVLELAATKSLEHLSLKGCSRVAMSDAIRLAEQLPDCLIDLPDGSRSWSPERIQSRMETLMAQRRERK